MTPHPYPAYRPSSVPWLGDLPAHWEVWRLKYAVQINPDTLSEDTDPEYLFDYMDINSVGTGYMSTLPVRQVFGNAPSRARRVMRTGDTAISTVRTYLKAAYHLQTDWPDLIASTGFAILRPPVTIVPALLGHTVQSDAFVRQVVANSVGVAYPAISETKLGTLFLPLPPLPEQHAIVRYLDYVDRRIRRYVRAKRKLVALLEEERQAIVNRAVTRGLDPDVHLKPSGVEWLGDVPEHWEVRRLKSQLSRNDSGVWGSDPNGIDDLPCVRVADFDRHRLRVRKPIPTLRAISHNERERRLLGFGDLLLEKSGGGDKQPVGMVMLYDHDAPAVCSNFIARMEVQKSFDPFFLTFLHSTLYAIRLNMRSVKQTTGIQNLDVAAYLSESVAFPPLPEQAAIVEFLDGATTSIGAAIARARRQIELVEEYRTRLIADVVTGKLDVREAVAQLPEEADVEEPIDEYDLMENTANSEAHALPREGTA